MSLNEQATNVPYLLGRLFSVYEQIQAAASPGINTTIKDRYFTSAAAQPSHVFPVLGDLVQKRLSQLDRGRQIYFGKQLNEIMPQIGEEFPLRLTLPEQGSFQLGYYFQNQQRFKSKSNEQSD